MITPYQKILIDKTKLKKDFDRKIFKGISWSPTYFDNHHELASFLQDKHPYTITIPLENLRHEYWNKKEYVEKTKIEIMSKYKELLYEMFFQEYGDREGNGLYGKWLNQYHLIWKKERKYESIDDYILACKLEPRFKEKILSRFRNHKNLFKERFRIERERYYHLPEPLNYIDWRTPYDTLFIWEEKGKKYARRGGSGSSGARETNSMFIYGLLEVNKIKPVPSYLFLYSQENTLLFIKKFDSLCVPMYFIGENYHLDHAEAEKLKESGMFITWQDFREVKAIEVVN